MLSPKRESTLHYLALFFVCLQVCEVTCTVSSVGCMDFNNKPVDWFIAYKLPHHTSVIGTEFYYMDANAKSWKYSPNNIDSKSQPIYYTLRPIYENSTKGSFMYMMYNDEKPDTHSATESYGHTKGVIAFDKQSGFWLVHSTPKFPDYRHSGYQWPDNGHYFGQTFLCVTYPYKEMNKIGKQLKYNYPQIYDKSFPQTMVMDNPDMAAVVLNRSKVSNPPWNHTEILISKGGKKFVSFAKFSKFNSDLYSSWLAPALGSSLLVESWQNGRGKLPSFCLGKYQVFNVRYIGINKSSFKQTRDHSKWAITVKGASKYIVCIGDINRQEHQEERAGGTVCFKDSSVWTSFYNVVKSYEKCPKLSVAS
ncbi:plancitoxin-1-like isoform X1 [Octopus vulgaris]|uniref:Plancitoxin-1-like isoform X1 n=1 Tax=Octopus vulgaris TaxID=6645 RepID=A0AA36BR16_OCTVU|nr:plancitoxin-1-like isoform X1 [Octopus vulgaris]